MIFGYSKNKKHRLVSGFTIIELITVIVVIGILSTIAYVSYNGVSAKARDTSILSDLDAMDGLQTDYQQKHSGVGIAYYSGDENRPDIGFNPSEGNVIDVVVSGEKYCIRGYNPSGNNNSIYHASIKESASGVCRQSPLNVASAQAIAQSPGGPETDSRTILSSTADDTLNSYYQGSNYGTDWNITLGDQAGYYTRIILKFDFSSLNIPAGSVITSATLSPYYYMYYPYYGCVDPVGKTMIAYRLTQTNWTESGANWNQYDGVNSWSSAGGDFTTANAVSAIFPASQGGYIDFTGSDMAAQIQEALDHASSTAHFLIKFADETPTENYSAIYFFSNNEVNQPTLRPKLYIEWAEAY